VHPIVLQFLYHNLQVVQQHYERTFAACNPAFRFALAPLHRINRSLLGLTSRAIFATCRIHAHNGNLVLHTPMHFTSNHDASIAPPLPKEGWPPLPGAARSKSKSEVREVSLTAW
jgi:hypothetical protein